MASVTVAPKAKRNFGWLSRTRINVFLDIILALGFAVEMEQHFTDLALHELIGLFLVVAFIVHIALHLDWVWKITTRFFHQIIHESRFNYLLNLALLIAMSITMVTGIGISRTLGLSLDVPHSWEQLHKSASNYVLLLVALHVAMHWKWIATNVRKYLFGWLPFGRRNHA